MRITIPTRTEIVDDLFVDKRGARTVLMGIAACEWSAISGVPIGILCYFRSFATILISVIPLVGINRET
jgi:hypothetical protein